MLPYRLLTIPVLAAALLTFAGCSPAKKDRTEDGRIIVTLWTSWAGIERKGIDDVIDDYNAVQAKVFVRSLNITDPQTKIMLATAGGNPPDMAIMNNQYIPAYAENNALTPLRGLAQREGIDASQFVPAMWDTCNYRERLWALPLTSSVTALHYNKAIFREIGIDPEQPPKTMEELERINDLVVQRRKDGALKRLGHLPLEPGWWRPEWSNWFGSGSYDKKAGMLFEEDGWDAAGNWLVSYTERFGADRLIKFRSGLGRFASPQNGFFAGKVCMVLQGIWMDNFIRNLAPEDFEYAVAPFPASENAPYPYFAIADVDAVIIPRGAKHVEEAFEFIQYLTSQSPMEKLALAHGKMTSLADVSPEFLEMHPHPYIHVFLEIANSGYAKSRPQFSQYMNYFADTNETVNSITYGLLEKKEALRQLQAKQQKELQAKLRRWKRVKEAREKSWAELDAFYLSQKN